MKTFLDTNVLAYAFDTAEPAKQVRAQELLRGTDPESLVVSTQVLSEFFVVVSRKLATTLSHVDAVAAVRSLSALQVVTADASLVQEAIELCEVHQLSYWDSLIVVAARRAGCEQLLSEDLQHGASLADLQVVNPFA